VGNEIAVQLNKAVESGIAASQLNKFEKAFALADARKNLITLLDKSVMSTFMSLQNSALGFKTDKTDPGKMYGEGVVRNAIIQAVLTGVQVVDNHFNIIAGNCYITKEGFGYLLKNIKGLSYEIIPGIPTTQGNLATIKVELSWNYKGEQDKRELKLPVKTNAYMGADGVIGKAIRKTRKWLYEKITDIEIPDGDESELKAETEVLKDEDVQIFDEEPKKTFEEIITDAPYGIQRVIDYFIYAKDVEIPPTTTIESFINGKECNELRRLIMEDKNFFINAISKMLSLEEAAKAKKEAKENK